MSLTFFFRMLITSKGKGPYTWYSASS